MCITVSCTFYSQCLWQYCVGSINCFQNIQVHCRFFAYDSSSYEIAFSTLDNNDELSVTHTCKETSQFNVPDAIICVSYAVVYLYQRSKHLVSSSSRLWLKASDSKSPVDESTGHSPIGSPNDFLKLFKMLTEIIKFTLGWAECEQ